MQEGEHQGIRRPWTIRIASTAMVVVAATWTFLGVAWAVVMARTEGVMLFRVLLAVLICALCGLLALMSGVSVIQTWRGTRPLLKIPAGFTASLFVVAVINLLIHRRIDWTPNQLIPIAVGLVAGAAIVLSSTQSAIEWFTRPQN